MKIAMQIVNDANGNKQLVQMSLLEWEKVLRKIRRYEQALKIKSDLADALREVAALRNLKGKKQTLSEFLCEI